MNTRVDETFHLIDLPKLQNDRKYKGEKLKEIISAICAVLNSNGGNVLLYNPCKRVLASIFPFLRERWNDL